MLALGISGGLLPCPSALVVLLSAISLHRVGYGLLLVVAFSAGLAGTLTAVGLAFVYAGRLFKSTERFSRALTVIPVFSALVISLAGLAICYGALSQAAPNFAQILFTASDPSFVSASALGVLSLGFVYGLKHATEADHIVAVSTIVSEHRKLTRAALVGGLWGIGHTASLVVVGAIVLALRIAIPERVANWLEFGVAIMIVLLGVMAFRRALRTAPTSTFIDMLTIRWRTHTFTFTNQPPLTNTLIKPFGSASNRRSLELCMASPARPRSHCWCLLRLVRRCSGLCTWRCLAWAQSSECW